MVSSSAAKLFSENYHIPYDLLVQKYNSYGEKMNAITDYKISHYESENENPSSEINGAYNYNEKLHFWKMVRDSSKCLTEDDYSFLVGFTPKNGVGFMFSTEPRLQEVNKRVEQGYDGHSGASYGMTMRFIHSVIRF